MGSQISNMLENASQTIACDFDASQGLYNIPLWVCSIAACGWALCFQHNDELLIFFHVMFQLKLSVKYFYLPSLQWKSQENIRTLHREKQAGQTVAIFEETHAIICDDLRWSAMHLEAQNRRKMSHFIEMCGRALRPSHTLQYCIPVMVGSKAPAMQENGMRCPAM